MPRPKKDAPASRSDINIRPCGFVDRPNIKFIVTGPNPGGRRWRKFFETRARADAYAHLRRVELSNGGTQGAALSTSQRAEYMDATARLEPYGITVREAVEMLLPTLAARRKAVAVEKAVAAMLTAQKDDGASRRHLEDLRSRLGQFERAFPGRPLARLSTEELDDWIRSLGVGAVTRNNFRRVVASLFAFGRARGWCAENPATLLVRATPAVRPVRILTPEQTAELLANAPLDCLVPLAIGAFAGLRRAELERLDWREVRPVKGLVEVTAGKAKTARCRFVPIRENLAAWLAPHARPEGPVCPVNWRKRFDAAREAAGLGGEAWPDNALRHGFASYHAAHFQDAGKLAAEMGHTTPGVIFQHYRELVEPDAAARYWNIRPVATPANVVPMLACSV